MDPGRIRVRMIDGKSSTFGLPWWSTGRLLALVLVGAILVCHGVFGALHLCSSHEGHMHQEHGHPSVEKGMAAHDEPPSCHVSGADYFAVLLTAFLGLVLGLPLRSARSWVSVAEPPAVERRFTSLVFYPPRGPTLPVLQVCRL